jgi:predicted enzyme related to lactoylglutathione lyase
MTSTILNITFDCADSGILARFWGAATGWDVHVQDSRPDCAEYAVGPASGGGPRLYFVKVPEAKVAKNRIHLDLIPSSDDQEGEVARLVSLGAMVAERQPPGVSWIVLADPEGNEFCVE